MYIAGGGPGLEHSPNPQPTTKMPSPLESVAKGVKVKSKLISWKSFSWLWVMFVLVLFVGNGILMVFLGLDLVNLGLSNPAVLIVWHFVLFVGFGVIAVVSGVYFTQEELLEDGLRLPVLAGLWTLYNGVASLLFLVWVVDNPKMHSTVAFSDNPSAYSSFIALNAVSFMWFWMNVVAIVLAWVIHYNQRKYLETLNRSLQITDHILMHYHGTTLYALMVQLGGGEPVVPGLDYPEPPQGELHEDVPFQEGAATTASHFSGQGASWRGTTAMMASRRDPVRGPAYASRPPRKFGRQQPQVRFRTPSMERNQDS